MSQTPHVDIPPEPYVPPALEGPRKTIRVLGASDPFRWLAAGWQDLKAHPGISAFYGISFCLMALVLGAVFHSKPEYTMSIASGCLLLGPFLAMGLYEVSQRRERGEIPRLSSSLVCWRSHVRSMSMLVLVLIVMELLWGRASLVVFAVFFNTGMPSTASVMQAVFNPEIGVCSRVHRCRRGICDSGVRHLGRLYSDDSRPGYRCHIRGHHQH
jgi:uncharacterized membrane protein